MNSALKPLVLIVEDEADLVTLLKYNLEKENFRTISAGDGEEALLLASEQVPSLVLLDWMLPLMSGLEVCRQMRRKPKTRDIPIIMLTARGEEADKVRGLNSGADDYIAKPFSPTELVARMRAVLRRSSPGLAEELLSFGDVIMDLAAHRVRAKAVTCIWGRPSSACCAISCSIPAACSRASSCSIWCGATTSMSNCGRSMSISAACGRP